MQWRFYEFTEGARLSLSLPLPLHFPFTIPHLSLPFSPLPFSPLTFSTPPLRRGSGMLPRKHFLNYTLLYVSLTLLEEEIMSS